MRIPRCPKNDRWTANNGHWFNKENICTKCGFDYNVILKEIEKFEEEIQR